MTVQPKDPEPLAAYLGTLDCVHCGLCLEHCPTYELTGRESANPRGRVYLMRAWLEGRAEATPDMVADLDLCLVCRACETACPSGVRFGEVITQVRERLRRRGWLRRCLMDRLLPAPGLLWGAMSCLRLWQRSGLRVLRHLLPERLRQMEAYLPSVPLARDRRPLPSHTRAQGVRQGSVVLLEGCLMRQLFGDVNRDTLRLLTAAGFDVLVPKQAGCCGALHEHDGALQRARHLARTNLAVWEAAGAQVLVTNSAGCGAGIQGYGHLLGTQVAQTWADRCVDISRFLLDHGQNLSFNNLPLRVTYDAPCHLHHAQQETSATLALLQRVPGLELVPLAHQDRCCGAAGVWNLDHPEESAQLLNDKLRALEATQAQALVTGNPGCLLQWQAGVTQRHLKVQVLHPVTLLARALE